MKEKISKLKLDFKAPNFKLPDQDGRIRKLSDFAGKWLLLYFYPKDDTPGCTKEACMIRDSFPRFGKLKVKVVGISVDSPQSHKKFIRKYSLPFVLLSDEKKETVKKYGVWSKKKFMGREYMGTIRNSFLIAPNGKIAKIYKNIKPEIHAAEVIKDLMSFVKKVQ